jgi:hypothetical protein
MSQIQCPSCKFAFDDGKTLSLEGLRGRMLYGPERLIVNARLDAASFDKCPSCGREFVAPSFRIFGEFVRARIRSMGGLYVAVLLLAAIAVVFLASSRGN